MNSIKLIILFLLLLVPIKVFAALEPTSDFYVNDYANILSDETKSYIMEKSVQLNNVDGTQIVVVTVESLEGKEVEDYALETFRAFGIGDKDKNNGLLILVSVKERKLRIEVGYGLEGIINDGKAGRIRDEYMIPYLKNDEWDEGIKNGYDALYSEIVKENNLDLEYSDAKVMKTPSNEEFDYIAIIGGLLGVIPGIVFRLIKGSKRIILTIAYMAVCVIIMFISAALNSESIAALALMTLVFFMVVRFSGIGGGGFSGGSSGGFSSGSSSSSGYSGGGGSSGGGGASGSF